MSFWQWAITVCLPVLTIDHVGMTIWSIIRRTDKEEMEALKKRDQEWQQIFKLIEASFVMTGKKLIQTWDVMTLVNKNLEKIILKKTERNHKPENPFGHEIKEK